MNMSKSKYYKGRRVKVFDSTLWMKIGDIKDNSTFWVDAIILRTRLTEYDDELLVDVMIGDRESKGHYIEGVKL